MKTYAASDTEDLIFYFGDENNKISGEVIKKAIKRYNKNKEKVPIIMNNIRFYKIFKQENLTKYLLSKDLDAIDEMTGNFSAGYKYF